MIIAKVTLERAPSVRLAPIWNIALNPDEFCQLIKDKMKY